MQGNNERNRMGRKDKETGNPPPLRQLTQISAHEIRNPLSSVKMNIQILLKNIKINGNDRRRMEIMASEISRLEGILTEMLDFAGPIKLDLKLVSLNEIADSCLEIIDARIKEYGISVKKRYSRNIPYVMMDHDKVEQAIINILLNSVEALKNGGQIEIITRRDMKNGGLVKVEINDNGVGIAAEDLAYVFDPFFSKKKKGTGLGLSNVKKIIETHGGTVTIAPGKKQGTHFCLSIPIRETL